MLSEQKKVKVCTAEFEIDCPHCRRSFDSAIDIEVRRYEINMIIDKLKAKL